MRWEAEEFYKVTKADDFDQRQFHARGAQGVRQEILAQALFAAIARFLLANAAKESGETGELSMKAGVLATANYLTRLLLGDPEHASRWLRRLLARLARARYVRRPGPIVPEEVVEAETAMGIEGRPRA